MTKDQIKAKILELEDQLGFAIYKQGSTFPHPHWAEDEKRLVKEIKVLKEDLKEIQD